MKKTVFVVALAVALTLAFSATAFATSAKTWNYQEDYYSWGSSAGSGLNTTTTIGAAQSTLGSGGSTSTVGFANTNPANPGVHANYQTTTAKCAICHSVHRAKADGVKLLNTATATCAGCHIAGTSTVTNVVIAWGTTAAPLAGPHSSTSGSCTSRACHATSPHGAGGSTYALFRSKLITAAVDVEVAAAAANPTSSGVSAAILDGTGGTADQRDSVITGYTCGVYNCHQQTMLPVIQAGWAEERVKIYSSSAAADNVPSNMVMKTGHMTGTAAADGVRAFAPVAGCTSCHDQADPATRSQYTFPHAQRPTGAGAGTQTYLWMNIGGYVGDTAVPMTNTNMKSFDGACLKCHRDATNTQGIGLTK